MQQPLERLLKGQDDIIWMTPVFGEQPVVMPFWMTSLKKEWVQLIDDVQVRVNTYDARNHNCKYLW